MPSKPAAESPRPGQEPEALQATVARLERELQVEAALERIRARSMAMHDSGELNDVLSVLFEQFNILGINPVWAHLSLINLEDNTFTYRMSRADKTNNLSGQVVNLNARPEWQEAVAAFKSAKPNSVSCLEFPREVLPQIWELFDESFSSLSDQFKIRMEDFPNGLYNTQGFCQFGYIGFNHNRPPTGEEKEIVVRIAKEFGRVYQRFLDLQKAEAQAREAQIEAALERVRAKAMAMNNTSDLTATAGVIFSELKALGITPMRSGVSIQNRENRNILLYSASATPKGHQLSLVGSAVLDHHPVLKEIYDRWLQHEDYYPELRGKQLTSYYKAIEGNFKVPQEQIEKEQFGFFIPYSQGCLYGWSEAPIVDAERNILKRFASVVDLTFNRYFDLQKAEAQAREARIEAALEKVRSRSLAMHRSEELFEVVKTVFDRLKGLDLSLDAAAIFIFKEDHFEYWFAASESEYLTPKHLPNRGTVITDDITRAREAHKNFISLQLSHAEKNKLFRYIFRLTDFDSIPEERKKFLLECEAMAVSVAIEKNSGIQLNNYSGKRFSEQDNEVLKRFGRVFEQAYTRFLDLKRAEAQAREAQIEASLERIRASSMAMHHSNELRQVALSVLNQIEALDIPHVSCDINIVDNETHDFISYAAHSIGSENEKVTDQLPLLNINEIGFLREVVSTKNKWGSYNTLELRGKLLEEMMDLWKVSNFSGVKNQYIEKKPEVIYLHWAPFHDWSSISLSSVEPLTDEQLSVLARIAKTFSLSYTRFLDLKRAEAQAREAEIQLALERVRAATMAMHSSSELSEVAAVLFRQMRELGVTPERVNIGIVQEQEGFIEYWSTEQGGRQIDRLFKGSIDEPTTLSKLYAGWKAGQPVLELHQSGKELAQWIRHLTEVLGIPFDERFRQERRVQTAAYFKHGMLLISTPEAVSQESLDLLSRFGKVFEQTYTRFLDLQKAEAQAREAQIEAALERVRARTMAMHRSEQLPETAKMLFEQFNELGKIPDRISIGIINEAKEVIELWVTDQSGTEIGHRFDFPFAETSSVQPLYRGWKAKKSEIVIDLQGETLKKWIRFVREEVHMEIDETHIRGRRVHHGAFFSRGFLLITTHQPIEAELMELLKRFAKVFDQTYTRFLDLQKAEDQAREAQIEAALERVRARAMAMHSSNELIEVANVMHEQMTLLQQSQLEAFVIHLYPEKGDQFEAWISQKTPGKENRGLTTTLTLSKKETKFAQQFFKLYLSEPKEYLIHAHGELLGEWNRMVISRIKGLKKAWGKNIPTSQYWFFCDFSGGSFLLVSRDEPNEESKELTRRASSVFDLAYRRFLDLQRAEAQAREAQIEAALERVRAASMAMRSSLELGDILARIFAELKSLDVEIDRCFIWVVEPEKEGVNCWIASPQSGSASYWFPFSDHPYFKAFMDVWREQKNLFKLEIKGTLKKSWDQYLFETTEFVQLPPEAKDSMRIPEKIHATSIANKYGLLCTAGQNTMSEEHIGIFRRFGAMFEQTYTRFLDLEKAEAQAREAQIEAALERVRARSMAMHKSDEMLEVGESVYRELSELGIASMTSGITLMDPDGKIDWYYMVSPEDGSIMKNPMGIPRDETKVMRSLTEGWEHKKPFHLVELDEKETILHQTYIAENSINFELTAEELISVTPEKLNLQTFNFKQGFLLLVGAEKLVGDQIDTTIRFAKAFEQTYTRFLDLQKAEAQAREARIEAALERVRAKSLAMHNSTEMAEVVAVLFDELVNLDLVLSRCIIWIIDPIGFSSTLWMANSEEDKKNAKSYHIPRIEHPYYNAIIKGWKKKMDRWVYELKGNQKKVIDKFLLTKTDLANLPEPVKKGIRGAEQTFVSGAFNRFGLIEASGPVLHTDQQQELLSRFSKVFEQSYQRFVDLQKAEAQAREAEIQLALERIRARSMAMRSSEELREVVQVMYEQVEKLGIAKWGCMLLLFDKPNQKIQGWFSDVIHSQYPWPFEFTDRDHEIIRKWWGFWESNAENLSIHLKDEEKHDFSRYLFSQTGMKDLPEDFKEFVMREPEVWFEYSNMACGLIQYVDYEPFPEESIPVLNRISQAFEQAYTRFLDLQKAEAQAREAEIQLALERVRAKSLAMKSSDELHEVLSVLFKQFDHLGIEPVNVFLSLFNREDRTLTYRASGKSGTRVPGKQVIEVDSMEVLKALYDKWLTDNSDTVEVIFYPREVLPQLFGIFAETFAAMPEEDRMGVEDFPDGGYSMAGYTPFGYLGYDHQRQATEEEKDILSRFCIEFTRVYQRFLEIQKAETQAREAQIEAALERVRAKTMAMHNTDDIAATVTTFFNELLALDPDASIRCGVGILSQSEHMPLWTASVRDASQTVLHAGTLDMSLHPLLQGAKANWARQGPPFSYTLKGSDLKRYFQALNDAPDYPAQFDLNAIPKAVYHNSFVFRDGLLFVFTDAPLPDDIRNILERFASVFGHTYTRYLDLQKAEQRARESEIEAGLERVRARSMAMHKSHELLDLSVVLFQELDKLGVRSFFNCGFVEVDEEKQKQSGWTTMTDGSLGEGYYLPLLGDAVLDARYRAWKQGEPAFCQKVSGRELESHMAFAMPTLGSERVRQMASTFPDPTYFYCFNFSHGYLSIISGEVLDPEAESILVRFTRAFEQAYIRFMDLQKAEAQAREAQIEAALERVRSRSMAMHHTGELQDVINTVYQQFLELKVPITGGAFIAINADIGTEMVCWGAGGTAEYIQEVHLPFMDMPIYTNLVAGIKKGPGFFVESFSREEKQQFFKALFRNPPYSEAPASRKKEILSRPGGYTRSCAVSRNTSIFIINHHGQPFSDEDNEILRRMGKVFEQTYTRFLDLQKAEAQAREASRQASIERVRGEIASMRSTADLERITPLIWNELTALGVPFIRCGVFIIQEQTQTIQTYLSAPDGHALGVMNLDFEAGETTRETVAHWRRKAAYQPRWTAEEFTAWTESLLEAGKIKDRKTYQDTERPPEMLCLNFIPFAQGMLYVGNTEPLEEEALELIQSLAEAFSFAYARYEDFNQLEKALSELKATQAQLIQSEKMASLGELTAGIAHEIKNPLNFVNNFSEVSRELLEELVEELEKGDIEEVRALARDVSQNLEKIVHHGMRADGIVKGMLQHSRNGDGKKEPTDLNALADEYLRLAYHGLRAKDKSFNATLETGFDPKVGLVELIPQDMGRVILNLLTNAFYAVSEKAREGRDGYVPTVAISTARQGGHVLVSVTDNGNGIPEKVREKIFQPFFTTKPTGQGTGLGLSMSYDIVTKGHGGSLEVKTESGVGTTFVIKLNSTP